MKGRLDAAAEQSGRSQSQEAELRLEQSFIGEDTLSRALDFAFPDGLGAVIEALALVMRRALETSAAMSRQVHHLTPDPLSDAFAFDQMMQAAQRFLDSVRPVGDSKRLADGTDATRHRFQRYNGMMVATGALSTLKRGYTESEDAVGFKTKHSLPLSMEQLRKRLGPAMIERIRVPEWPPREERKEGAK